MSEEVTLLKEISKKLDQLIILTKLSNLDKIAEIKEELRKDPTFQAILDLADGTTSSSQIILKVTQQTQLSERTIQRKIAELVEKGALNTTRKGRDLYHENSGMYG